MFIYTENVTDLIKKKLKTSVYKENHQKHQIINSDLHFKKAILFKNTFVQQILISTGPTGTPKNAEDNYVMFLTTFLIQPFTNILAHMILGRRKGTKIPEISKCSVRK